MVDVGVGLMNAGVDLIVIDSITSMLPAIYFEKDTDEMKALEALRSRRNQKTVPLSNVISNPPTTSVSVVSVAPNPIASGFKRNSTGGQRRAPEKSLLEKMQEIQKKNQA
jgi:hypothetical protein